MNRRKQRLEAELDLFVRRYARKKPRGGEPNDRNYSRKTQRKIRKLSAAEFDALVHGREEEE
ncbi:MAG: hypothetical protein KBG84_04070 [Planctomycetes bacterium]|nr:hypothetical protein [Planctomycetota bacterium]